jgi:integrase
MASVFLNKKKSKYWIACITVGGKQVQRSTHITDKGQAEAIANLYEQIGRKAEAGILSEEIVRATINFILHLAGHDPLNVPTIRDWFKTWITNVVVSLSPGTSARYSRLTDEFLESLGAKADKSLQALSVGDVEKFREFLIAEGEAPASVNLVLKAIRSCLNRALAQGHIQHNRASAVDLVQREKGKKDKRPFTAEELARIIAAAPSREWRELILCGYYIGDRIGSLVLLRFEYFDLEQGFLTYTPGKQMVDAPEKSVTLPLHPSLKALSFRKIIDDAGVTYKTKASRGGRGRVVHEVGFHADQQQAHAAGAEDEIRINGFQVGVNSLMGF